MKPRYLVPLFIIPLAAFAQQAPAQQDTTDYKAVATIIRQQRDNVAQALQDAQLQIALLQQQLKSAQEKIADLEKAQTPPQPKK